MLEFSPDTGEAKKEVKRLITQISALCEGSFFCFYQNQGKREEINRDIVIKTRLALKELGHVEKLSILVDSPGGGTDDAFHLVRAFRRYADNIEVFVVNWAKSGATFVCLGADKILMGENGELGPLDVQLTDPRGSVTPKSALNAFKSLEYLQRYAMDTLDLTTLLLMLKGNMDIPYALEKALPFVSCVTSPLYQQVNPMELGEARRHLAVGEEYCKRIMKRYGYSSLSKKNIEQIVKQLVWDYPSHSFVIDFEEAKSIGLNVEELDNKRVELCEELLSKVKGCFGFLPPEKQVMPPEKQVMPEEKQVMPKEKQEKHKKKA